MIFLILLAFYFQPVQPTQSYLVGGHVGLMSAVEYDGLIVIVK